MMNLRQTTVFFFSGIHRWSVILSATLLISQPGCQSTEPVSEPEHAAESQDAPQSVRQVPLEIADWNRVQELVRERKGRIVVVDLWSNSCLPCIREFPKFVSLGKRFPDDVDCISLNCDYFGGKRFPPESFREQVQQFLTKQQADFPNILNDVASDEFFPSIDLASIPATYVFNREGEVAKRFDNDQGEYGKEGYTYEKDVIPFIESLIRPSPP